MKVINFVGGPGSGKSTTAAGVFFGMKVTAQHPVELVTEHAKELTYAEAWKALENQQAVTSEQDQRQRRLQGHVDYVITDSPLFLGCVYGRGLWAEEHMHSSGGTCSTPTTTSRSSWSASSPIRATAAARPKTRPASWTAACAD